MPKLMNSDTDTALVPGTSMQFSFTRPENLGATEYTLVTIVVDVTGSVEHFSKELLETVKSIVKACKPEKCSRSDYLLIRLVTFNTRIIEIHGFVPVSSINEDDYEELDCSGLTALYDATYECIGATLVYAKTLIKKEFDVNGITFIVTDGYDNASRQSNPGSIKKLIEYAKSNEEIESLLTVLIGINSGEASYFEQLQLFKDEANLNQFVDAGKATPQKLAKLVQFMSQSISSQSKALGTGGPSQPLNF